MNCIHYKICVNSDYLCNDSNCPLIKNLRKKEDEERIERVCKIIDDYKKELGVKNFLELNKKFNFTK